MAKKANKNKSNKKGSSSVNKNKSVSKNQNKQSNSVKDVSQVSGGKDLKQKDQDALKNGSKKDMKQPVLESSKKDHSVMELASNDELKKLGIVIVVLVIIFFVFYGITAFVHRNDDNHDFDFTDNTPVEIQYDEILVGEILNQNVNEYYVLLGREDDAYVDLYSYYISKYKAIANSLKVYTVDVDNVFNKGYIADASNLQVTNLSEMKIAGTALLQVRDHRIVASYEGEEQIVSKLKELIG